MLKIGCHVSFNKNTQMLGSLDEALSYGCNCFMFYTGAPQNTNRCEISEYLTNEAINKMKENNISVDDIIIHAPYIINLGNNFKKDSYNFAINFLKEEIKRVEKLGVKYLVLHPGSYVSLTLEDGINNIINALNEVIRENQKVFICLETMAGKGSEVGHNLDQIVSIFNGVKYNSKLKVCLDTCHLNDSGVDIKDFDSYLDMFDKMLGLDKIACIHINDSKNIIGSKKDRHENFGYGTIGFDNLINVIYNKRLDNIPMILETPYTGINKEDKNRIYPPYKFEIDMIKNKRFNPNLYIDIKKYYDK